ncbi:uncharacterized protein EDB93DRAFT_1115592 [Suillus bovinus]|uniref:uncharacterized protein n=1 Tax=Suillus bovinus TaxID=48563 RepID=UPI001B86587A|nr:uncharacterized protein EDB93DRAFT_1115592 [Suillus bovinus]KAG2159410.1 hypothetical protein EDB93DRAFT_1115592 [Suillus bovinus]
MFKSTTTAMLALIVSECVVIAMFISWFIWATRELDIFKRLVELILSARRHDLIASHPFHDSTKTSRQFRYANSS